MVTMPTEPAMLMVRAFVDASSRLVEVGLVGDESDDRSLELTLMTVEGTVAVGLASFDSISQLDTAWHTADNSGLVEFNPRISEIILDGYRGWHESTKKYLPIVDRLEARARPVVGADALRASFRESAGIITPDDPFFAGDELDRLAADAVSAHEQGKTAEFTELDD